MVGGLPEPDVVRLFAARQADAAFCQDQATSTIAANCRRLDALPLGLELAAFPGRNPGTGGHHERLDQRSGNRGVGSQAEVAENPPTQESPAIQT